MREIKKQENLVYSGKSKDVYNIPFGEHAGKYLFVFTDRATGYIDDKGNVHYDSGYDKVVGEIEGKGKIACKLSTYFFKLLKEKQLSTHYITTISDNEMVVEPALPISMPKSEFEGSEPLQNLEWTFRVNVMGSLWRRYSFLNPGDYLDYVVESWTKGKKDVLITFDVLESAGVMSKNEINYSVSLVKNIAKIISDEFKKRGLHLIDGKLELGRFKGNNKIILIDEISSDVLKVCNNYKPNEKKDCLNYKECIETKLSDDGKREISGKYVLGAKKLEEIFLDRIKD